MASDDDDTRGGETRFDALRRRFRPPRFSVDEDERVAAIVHNMLSVLLVIVFVTLIVQFAISGPASGMLGLVATAAWVTFLMALLRRGHVQLTALLLILNLMLLVNVSSVGYGGIHSPTMGANLLVILMAIVLVRPRAVLIVAGAILACMISVYVIDTSGLDEALPFPRTPNTPEMALMTHCAHLLGAGYFLALAVRGLNQAIERAQQEERRASALLSEARVARGVAEQASQAKTQFLANMSHELRTPLNAVIGYSEMLLEEEPESRAELESIHKAGSDLLQIISDILDITKIESGRMALELSEFSVRELAEELARDVRPIAARRGNRLELELEPALDEVFTVTADRPRVRQIVLNLLTNAAKFTERGLVTLKIRVERAATPRALVFEVHDTGIGIEAPQLSRIFESFHQVDNSSTREYGGVGLGLALSRALAEMMSARVSAESVVGRGSVFRLQLPLEPPRARADADDGE